METVLHFVQLHRLDRNQWPTLCQNTHPTSFLIEFPLQMIYFLLRKKLKMKNRVPLYASFLLIFLVSGCAHVISKELRANSDISLH